MRIGHLGTVAPEDEQLIAIYLLHLLSGLSALASYRDARHLDETGTLHD